MKNLRPFSVKEDSGNPGTGINEKTTKFPQGLSHTSVKLH